MRVCVHHYLQLQLQAVGDDFRVRVWYADSMLTSGLLFACSGGLPSLQAPIGETDFEFHPKARSSLKILYLGRVKSALSASLFLLQPSSLARWTEGSRLCCALFSTAPARLTSSLGHPLLS